MTASLSDVYCLNFLKRSGCFFSLIKQVKVKFNFIEKKSIFINISNMLEKNQFTNVYK